MLKLVKFEAGDIQKLLDWVHDADFLVQWAGPTYEYPLTKQQLLATLELSQAPQPTIYMFKAITKLEASVVGHIELLKVNRIAGTATIGRVLIGDQASRRQGLGRAMLCKTLDFAFQNLGLKELELGVFRFNQSALRLYSSLGFKIYKEVLFEADLKAKFRNLVRMKLLRETWVANKEHS